MNLWSKFWKGNWISYLSGAICKRPVALALIHVYIYIYFNYTHHNSNEIIHMLNNSSKTKNRKRKNSSLFFCHLCHFSINKSFLFCSAARVNLWKWIIIKMLISNGAQHTCLDATHPGISSWAEDEKYFYCLKNSPSVSLILFFFLFLSILSIFLLVFCKSSSIKPDTSTSIILYIFFFYSKLIDS